MVMNSIIVIRIKVHQKRERRDGSSIGAVFWVLEQAREIGVDTIANLGSANLTSKRDVCGSRCD